MRRIMIFLLTVTATVFGLLLPRPPGASAAAWSTTTVFTQPGAADYGATMAAVARFPGHRDIFWVRPDGAIATTWWNERTGWGTPFTVAPPGSGARRGGVSAVSRYADHLDVFWVRPDGAVATTWWDARTGWGTPFLIAPVGSALPGAKAIASVARYADHLDVFWVQRDNGIGTTWWDARTGWGRPFTVAPASGTAVKSLTALARFPDHLDLFWSRTDNAVMTTWWDARTGWGTPFPVAPPGSAVTMGLAAVSRYADHLDVFWVDRTGAIATAWWDARTGWARPTAVSPPGVGDLAVGMSAISRGTNSLDLFFSGRFNALTWLSWQDGQGWSRPLTVVPPGQVAGPLVAVAPTADVVDVYWADLSQALSATRWSVPARPTPNTPTGGRMTAFDPSRFGFQFRNDFVTEPIQDVRFGGLCGGMSYAALDLFYAGRNAPRQSTPPVTGSPMFRTVYDRQVTSITENADKWAELAVNPFGWRTAEFFNWGLQGFNGGRLQELRQQIDAGRPVPLGLFKAGNGGAGPHHQVVAIGYDLGRYAGDLGPFAEDLKIYIYDPNHPNAIMTLVPSVRDHSYHYLEAPGEAWMTYFVDLKYRPAAPMAFTDNPGLVNGNVSQLTLAIATGADDLRGGNDNVNATIFFRDRAPLSVPDLNFSARWIPRYQQFALVPIGPAVPLDQITDVVLTTTGGDSWNVDALTVMAAGTVLFHASGNPLMRFTGSARTYTAHLR